MQGAPARLKRYLGTMRNEDHPVIDCPHRRCARDGQDYEQRLQEQPSRVVRSDVHRTPPHTNWVEVTSRRFPPPLVVVSRTQLGEKTDDVAHDIRYATRITDSTRTSREVRNGPIVLQKSLNA